jgi:Cu/Ag efflux pump CusA
MYSPLAWVIIGGLLSSTLVARIVTPAIYKLIPPAIDVQATVATTPGGAQIAPAPG